MTLDKVGKKSGKIVGVVVDVVRNHGGLGHMDSFHPQGVGHRKISRIVFEHRGTSCIQSVRREYLIKGGAIWLGVKTCMFNAIDRIEQTGQAAPGDNLFCIWCRSIGVDYASAGQCLYSRCKIEIGRKGGKVDVVHFAQVGGGVHIVVAHQTSQGGAMFLPIGISQVIGL